MKSKKTKKRIKIKIKNGVKKRFETYKNLHKLTNVTYGKKAIIKMASIMYPNDKINKQKFLKKYNDLNSVYFFLNHKVKEANSHDLLIKNKDISLSSNIAKDVKERKYNLKNIK